VANAACLPGSSACHHGKRAQLHSVQKVHSCLYLGARLRLWATRGGASSGGAEAVAAGDALHRWESQGGVGQVCRCAAESSLLFVRLACSSPPPLLGSSGAAPACGSGLPALTLLDCRAWGLRAAQQLLGGTARGRSAAMLVMLPPPHYCKVLPSVARRELPGVQERDGWWVESARGGAAAAGAAPNLVPRASHHLCPA
jgi:hypothetical protein